MVTYTSPLRNSKTHDWRGWGKQTLLAAAITLTFSSPVAMAGIAKTELGPLAAPRTTETNAVLDNNILFHEHLYQVFDSLLQTSTQFDERNAIVEQQMEQCGNDDVACTITGLNEQGDLYKETEAALTKEVEHLKKLIHPNGPLQKGIKLLEQQKTKRMTDMEGKLSTLIKQVEAQATVLDNAKKSNNPLVRGKAISISMKIQDEFEGLQAELSHYQINDNDAALFRERIAVTEGYMGALDVKKTYFQVGANSRYRSAKLATAQQLSEYKQQLGDELGMKIKSSSLLQTANDYLVGVLDIKPYQAKSSDSKNTDAPPGDTFGEMISGDMLTAMKQMAQTLAEIKARNANQGIN